MKSLERVVLVYLKDISRPFLDPLQFIYRTNRSVNDAVITDRRLSSIAVWCSLNHLELNNLKTVEMIVDFRRNPPALPPLNIMDSTVAAVESFRFLGTTISQDLKWDNHIDSIAKNAQQGLYFLHQLRKFNLPQEIMKQFYSAIIKSVLCSSIAIWFGSATKTDMKKDYNGQSGLLRGLSVTLCPAPKSFTHPPHSLFEMLPSGQSFFDESLVNAKQFPSKIYIFLQWGKKVFSQPPIVQVLPLKKMREACNFHHRFTSTMRDKIRKKIQKITFVGFFKNLFANYGGK